MSALDQTNPLRPAPTALSALVQRAAMSAVPSVFAGMRALWPIGHFRNTWIVTRYDDVREVFANDALFGVVWRENLDVITGGQPFFLGMGDTPEYKSQL